MSKARRILTAVFLMLFTLGALPALIGEITAVIIYWFMLAVIFCGLWFITDGQVSNAKAKAPPFVNPPSSDQSCPNLNSLSKGSRVLLEQFLRIQPLPVICGTLSVAISTVSGVNAFVFIASLMLGVPALRSWCRRRTAARILKKDSIDAYFTRIYLPCLWSYTWRSCATVFAASTLLALGSINSASQAGQKVGEVIAFWIFASFFVIDVPIRVRRRIEGVELESMKETPRFCATPKPPIQS
jgi:hypothetical protein